MSYTSEDLAALPKIAERLRAEANEYFEPYTTPDSTAQLLYADADALIKAHAEIVRLQGEPTDEMVEAAAKAYADNLPAFGNENYFAMLAAARAALKAAWRANNGC